MQLLSANFDLPENESKTCQNDGSREASPTKESAEEKVVLAALHPIRIIL
jgi:hypothetical protein